MNSLGALLAEMQCSVHQLWVEAWSDCRIALGTRCRLHGRHLTIFDVLEKADESARCLMAGQVDRTAKKAAPISKEDEEEY
jgi:hypothetical protein